MLSCFPNKLPFPGLLSGWLPWNIMLSSLGSCSRAASPCRWMWKGLGGVSWPLWHGNAGAALVPAHPAELDAAPPEHSSAFRLSLSISRAGYHTAGSGGAHGHGHPWAGRGFSYPRSEDPCGLRGEEKRKAHKPGLWCQGPATPPLGWNLSSPSVPPSPA